MEFIKALFQFRWNAYFSTQILRHFLHGDSYVSIHSPAAVKENKREDDISCLYSLHLHQSLGVWESYQGAGQGAKIACLLGPIQRHFVLQQTDFSPPYKISFHKGQFIQICCGMYPEPKDKHC